MSSLKRQPTASTRPTCTATLQCGRCCAKTRTSSSKSDTVPLTMFESFLALNVIATLQVQACKHAYIYLAQYFGTRDLMAYEFILGARENSRYDFHCVLFTCKASAREIQFDVFQTELSCGRRSAAMCWRTSTNRCSTVTSSEHSGSEWRTSVGSASRSDRDSKSDHNGDVINEFAFFYRLNIQRFDFSSDCLRMTMVTRHIELSTFPSCRATVLRQRGRSTTSKVGQGH